MKILLIILVIIIILLIILFVKCSSVKKQKQATIDLNNQLNIKNEQLEQEINQKNMFITQLKQQSETLTNEKRQLELVNVSLVQQNEQASNEVSQVKHELQTLRTELANNVQKMEQHQHQLEASRQELIKEQQAFNQYVNGEQTKLAQLNAEINDQKQELQTQQYNLKLQAQELEEEAKHRLYKIANLDEDKAVNIVLDQVRAEKRSEISKEITYFDNKLQLDKKEMATDILLSAMENLAGETVTEGFSKVVKIPEETIKGRLIGRDGRNINLLENLLGVNILIDETPGQFLISSFNPVRRAIAYNALERLISSGRINQAEIEDTVKKVEDEIHDNILDKGKQAVNMFDLSDIHISLVEKLGCLYYRTSYGQNVYTHSVEVAKIARSIANQLGLDGKLAARCALLHDVGKVDSEELGLSHVELGATYATRANEPKEVINAIMSHHGDEEVDNVYSIITIIADSISASQIGARSDTYEAFIQRVEALEELALTVKGVNKAYALKGGKELRIIVTANQVKDSQLKAVAHEVKRLVETNLSLPTGIVVNVLRENRYITNAKKTVVKDKDE